MYRSHFSLFLLAIFCCGVAQSVAAQGPPVITIDQKSVYKKTAEISVPGISVPTVFDVSIDGVQGIEGNYALVESSQEIPHASVLLSDRKSITVPLRATDTSNPKALSNRAVDGNDKTFTPYEYFERKDEEGRIIPNTVSIDITADELIETSSLSILFGKNVQKPRTIRVATLNNAGEENIILTQRPFFGTTVSFPTVRADSFRVTFEYMDYLRITELRFHASNVQQEVSQKIRFNATPGQTYRLYYDADRYVRIDTGEQPRLEDEQNVPLATLGESSANPSYKQADTDSDGIVDGSDNCVTIANTDQTDKDENGIGDACEDFDRDGVTNAKDNCRDQVNRAQRDSDGDGVGDACDNNENRLLVQYPWIPLATVLLVVTIVSALILKVLRDSKRSA